MVHNIGKLYTKSEKAIDINESILYSFYKNKKNILTSVKVHVFYFNLHLNKYDTIESRKIATNSVQITK